MSPSPSKRPVGAAKKSTTSRRTATTTKRAGTKPKVAAVQTKKVAAKAVPAKKVAVRVVTKRAPAKPLVAKKVVAKKVMAKRVPTNPVLTKKVAAKVVPTNRVVAKKVAVKKVAVKKVAVTKRVVAKKVAVKKVAAKKVAVTKRVVAKKVAAKKVAAKKAAARPPKVEREPKPAVKVPSITAPFEDRTDLTFAELGVSEDVLVVLKEHGIDAPFAVQALTIPDGLDGRDVCGQAKTGSGKTLAFGIPLVMLVKAPAKPRRPSALVLVPTRELAAQVEGELVWLAEPRGLKVVSIYGGVSMDHQKAGLNAGAEIVVATPGRLIDLMGRGDIFLDSIRFLVVDEADRMCDMGFMPNLEWLLRHMPRPRQTMLFSATLGSDVNSLVKHELVDPVRHTVESSTTTVEESVHHFIQVHQMDRVKVVAAIVGQYDRGIVFLNTKRACDRMADDLKELGITARAIHGDLTQERRNRALKQFSLGQVHVLVATDVAARGLHIEGVDVVVQADLPDDHKTYLHRSGRTARAGATGVVVTLVQWNQQLDVTRLQKRLGMSQAIPEMFSNDPRLADLASWAPVA